MPKDKDRPVWCLVMFDLPVQTRDQRKAAHRFRKLLLREGFWMAQYSVYAHYFPSVKTTQTPIQRIKRGLPEEGFVRILYQSDRAWASGQQFRHRRPTNPDPSPTQLAIFGTPDTLETPGQTHQTGFAEG